MHGPMGLQGFAMTRASFLSFFVGNCHGLDVWSSKAKPRRWINVVPEKISAHSVAFLIKQAVNSHYSHHAFISFVTLSYLLFEYRFGLDIYRFGIIIIFVVSL